MTDHDSTPLDAAARQFYHVLGTLHHEYVSSLVNLAGQLGTMANQATAAVLAAITTSWRQQYESAFAGSQTRAALEAITRNPEMQRQILERDASVRETARLLAQSES